MRIELRVKASSDNSIDQGFDVVEISLLLTTRQAEALCHVSCGQGITAGQLVRRAIEDFLVRDSLT